MQVEWVVAIVCMAVLAVRDIREKEVPVAFLALFGLASVSYVILRREQQWMSVAYSLIPGVFLLAVSLCTRESVGYGDGWAVMALGLWIGMEGCFIALCLGLVLSAVCSVVLLVLHKVNGKSRLPFLPFITIGLGVWMIVQKAL